MSATRLAEATGAAQGAAEESAPRTAQPTGAEDKPFVGLVPLGEEDANLLAGRDEIVKVLTTNLRAARLTLLYGPSGVGKSSILCAGVVPALLKLAQEELNRCGAPSFAVAFMNSWADDPFKQLADSVRDGIRKALDVETISPLPIMTSPLSPSAAGGAASSVAGTDLVKTLATWTSSYGLELLIIFDQFEEYFLYHDKEEGPGTFADEFPRAANALDLRVRFLLSLRDDSLYKLDRFHHNVPALFENRLPVTPLTVANAREAIRKAIDAYNGKHPEAAPVEIEERLIDAVLDQVRLDNLVAGVTGVLTSQRLTQPPVSASEQTSERSTAYSAVRTAVLSVVRAVAPIVSALPKYAPPTVKAVVQSAIEAPTQTPARPSSPDDYIDAPYMQLVMSRLWDEESTRWRKAQPSERRLRFETLTRLGSAQAVVEQHLSKVMENFPAREWAIASDCFFHLVTPTGTKYALTPYELKKYTRRPVEEIEPVLQKLADNRFRILRRVDKKGLNGIDTAYEAYHDRLALAMLAWRARYKEQRAQRWKRLRVLAILLPIGLLIAYTSYLQRSKATMAEVNANLAQENTNAVRQQLVITEKTSTEAEQSDRVKLADLRSLAPKFTCGHSNDNLQPDAQKINGILQIDCAQIAQIASSPSDTPLPPRIYLHIQDEAQREAANELAAWLKTQRVEGRKVIVPGVEYVGPRTFHDSQLRYFHDNLDERLVAVGLISTLKDVCVRATPQLVKGYEESTAIRPRHYELWLTPDAFDNFRCANNSPAQQQ